jgi:arylsulfatase A-like enzyme
MNQSIKALASRVPKQWRFWDCAAIGFLGGLALTLLEAIDRTIVLLPFFNTLEQRFLFLAYFSPMLLSATLIGVLIGGAVAALETFRQLEKRWLGTAPRRRWQRWIWGGIRWLWLGAAAAAIAILLRPSVRAVGRRLSALGKGPMRRFSPDLFELIKTGFQWAQTHSLVIIGLMAVLAWLMVRWISRWPAIQRIGLSKAQGWALALLMLLSMGGAYALDSRYYFSIYDRSVHLPLFFVQLGVGLIAAALIYRALDHRWLIRIKLLVGVGVVAALGLTALTFLRFDTDQSLKALFWSRSVVARRPLIFLQWVFDFDRDGFASILGGGDCDDSDPQIQPLARDIPGNGRDDNCLGGDLKLGVSGQGSVVSGESADLTRQPSATPDHGPQTKGKRQTTKDKRQNNILLITIDALRADHLSCYGYARPTSPHLDQFARQGQLFVNAYSQGTNTGHSFASMFRSAYGEAIFDDERPTFIEILAGHRYTTVSFSAKRIEKWLRGQTWERYKPTLLKGIQRQAHSGEQGQWSADDITDEVTKYLKTNSASQPYFIWAHYLEPHYPYRPHPGFDFGQSPIDRYDSEIAYTDQALGRLFEYLDQSGDWANTLVIISADHGEAFFEHGQREHSSRPYQEQIHVPLLMRCPGEAPQRVQQPSGLIDLAPTMLRLAGIDPPAEYDGVDLFSPTAQADRPIFSETPRNIPEPSFYVWAMIDGSWKFMYDVVGHTFELYDLHDDPGERRNLVDVNAAKTQEMNAKFGIWFDRQSLLPLYSGDWSVRHILRK